jgi:hypothetical protein
MGRCFLPSSKVRLSPVSFFGESLFVAAILVMGQIEVVARIFTCYLQSFTAGYAMMVNGFTHSSRGILSTVALYN